MKRISGCLTILLTLCGNAFAMDVAVIKLNDGTTVHGRVVSFGNGRYTVESKSLGTIKISQDNIKSISSEHEKSRVAKAAISAGSELQVLTKEMQENEEIRALIRALQDDPELQALMNDPAVMKAISVGDLSTLMSNPRIMKLVENPKVREIQKKLAPVK